MTAITEEQRRIRQWFNQTYARRGELYLRPVDAYTIFLHLLRPAAGQRLLDVACGLGRLLQAAEPYDLQRYGVDISDVAVEKCQQRLPDADIREANAEVLPFPDAHFDHITCIGSLERFISLEKALTEQLRVAKPDARFCYMVRNSKTWMWSVVKDKLGLRNKAGHQNAKSIDEWTAVFTLAGFEIESVIADQWPMQRIRRWLSLGLFPVDYRRIRSGIKPLEFANEFIFLLRKKTTHGQ